MLEIKENLWNFVNDYKVITTNGIIKQGKLVMGAGVALQARNKYDSLDSILGDYVQKYGNRPFIVKQYNLITWPTKTDFRRPSELEFVIAKGLQVLDIVNKYKIERLYCPPPGCGNGGLNWNKVKLELEKFLDDRFIFCIL